MTTLRREHRDGETRSGILSIPASAIRWFYSLFSIGTVYLTIANTVKEAAAVNAVGWLEIQSIATIQLVQAAGASAAGAAIIVEGGNMVLAALLTEQKLRKAREQGIEEGREEGREEGEEGREEEGREETRTLWEAWNRRRLEAEARGEAFTEPPPTDGHPNGTSQQS